MVPKIVAAIDVFGKVVDLFNWLADGVVLILKTTEVPNEEFMYKSALSVLTIKGLVVLSILIIVLGGIGSLIGFLREKPIFKYKEIYVISFLLAMIVTISMWFFNVSAVIGFSYLISIAWITLFEVWTIGSQEEKK